MNLLRQEFTIKRKETSGNKVLPFNCQLRPISRNYILFIEETYWPDNYISFILRYDRKTAVMTNNIFDWILSRESTGQLQTVIFNVFDEKDEDEENRNSDVMLTKRASFFVILLRL